MDVTRLAAMGWRPPETFVVKAADGVTDIYGNMWKPFDFDLDEEVPDRRQRVPGPADRERDDRRSPANACSSSSRSSASS